jgi:hypothetical protein
VGEYEDGPYGLAAYEDDFWSNEEMLEDVIDEYFEEAPTYIEYPQYSVRRGGIQFPTQDTLEASADTGEKMKTNTQLATEAEQLRAEAERLEQILAAREEYGDDPFKNGAVLKVDMKYRGTTRSYAYAVIKTAGKFWLSGKLARTGVATAEDAQPTGMTWEQFVGWLSQGDATVWQAGGLRQVL